MAVWQRDEGPLLSCGCSSANKAATCPVVTLATRPDENKWVLHKGFLLKSSQHRQTCQINDYFSLTVLLPGQNNCSCTSAKCLQGSWRDAGGLTLETTTKIFWARTELQHLEVNVQKAPSLSGTTVLADEWTDTIKKSWKVWKYFVPFELIKLLWPVTSWL